MHNNRHNYTFTNKIDTSIGSAGLKSIHRNESRTQQNVVKIVGVDYVKLAVLSTNVENFISQTNSRCFLFLQVKILVIDNSVQL